MAVGSPPPSSSAASNYLASFRQVGPVPGFENVLSTAATAGLLDQIRQEREISGRMAGQALTELGANKRQKMVLDYNKWATEQTYKRATVADKMTARNNRLIALSNLGGTLGAGSSGRRQAAAQLLSQAGALAHTERDRFGPTLTKFAQLGGLTAPARQIGADLLGKLDGVQGDPVPSGAPLPASPQFGGTAAATPVAPSMTPTQGQAPVIAQPRTWEAEVLSLVDEDDRKGNQPATG